MKAHQEVFGSRDTEARFVFVPYRICPLGAHVDHQLGIVTGLTIDTGVSLAFVPNRGRVRLASRNFPGLVEFELDHIPAALTGDWGNYARGAAAALGTTHSLENGFDAVIAGELPAGGVSTSAAVGLAYLLAFETVNGFQISPEENVRLDQIIENRYIGLNNGILDPSVIMLAQEQSLLLLDCQSGDRESVPTPDGDSNFEIAVVYSGLSRSLVETDYNRRVDECQEAARWLLQRAGLPSLERPVLRHVPREVFDAYATTLPETLRKRAQHFLTRTRVPPGVDAWRAGDLAQFGRLVNASGESSISNYEAGAPHLISLYRLLLEIPGVYGTRFSGAGFRGSAFALIHPAAREDVRKQIQSQYPRAHPDTADKFSIHFCRPGTGVIER